MIRQLRKIRKEAKQIGLQPRYRVEEVGRSSGKAVGSTARLNHLMLYFWVKLVGAHDLWVMGFCLGSRSSHYGFPG